MARARLARGLAMAAVLAWAAASSAQTAWPAFMPDLLAGPSESAVRASLPDGVKIEPPDASLAPQRARFSGIWHGWACFARQCDVNIAIEGVINFVGGWLGEACPDAGRVNTALFQRGSAFKRPELWLYGDEDPYYSLAHSRKNHEAFVAAGGQASFVSYSPPAGRDGHSIYLAPSLWSADLDKYLRQVDGR